MKVFVVALLWSSSLFSEGSESTSNQGIHSFSIGDGSPGTLLGQKTSQADVFTANSLFSGMVVTIKSSPAELALQTRILPLGGKREAKNNCVINNCNCRHLDFSSHPSTPDREIGSIPAKSGLSSNFLFPSGHRTSRRFHFALLPAPPNGCQNMFMCTSYHLGRVGGNPHFFIMFLSLLNEDVGFHWSSALSLSCCLMRWLRWMEIQLTKAYRDLPFSWHLLGAVALRACLLRGVILTTALNIRCEKLVWPRLSPFLCGALNRICLDLY